MRTATSVDRLKKAVPKNNNLSVESFADLFDPRLLVNCRCSGGGGFLSNSEECADDLYEALAYAFTSVAQPRNIEMRPKMAHQYGTKETEMQVKFNVETLMALASVNVKDEYQQYDALPAGIQAALKRKMKEQEDAKAEAAAESVLYLVNASDESIKRRVDRIRALRREVDMLKGEITHIERSKAYGLQTQYFVPLAAALGFVSHAVPGAAVPDNFAKTGKK
jgi:hypothetical protein